ncbi:hypothetical protein HYZ05_00200 [Candidatus Daviesbacteria bacterium]|nr:hypothetical protein [Candidatus Daviesbacteria bacterium]
MAKQISKIRRVKSELEDLYGRVPTESELRQVALERTNVPEATVDTALKVLRSGIMVAPASLDKEVFPEDDTTLIEFVADKTTDTELEATRAADNEQLAELMKKAMVGLTPIQQRILLLRFVHEYPLKSVAEKVGLPEGHVIIIQGIALRELRKNEQLARWMNDDPDIERQEGVKKRKETQTQWSERFLQLIMDFRKKGMSKQQISQKAETSIATIQRVIRKLIEDGRLPVHALDRRTVDKSGATLHTRMLDNLVAGLLLHDPKLRNKEIVITLENVLGKRVTTLTIERSRLRLAASGRIEKRNLSSNEVDELSQQVVPLKEKGMTNQQIADLLKQPLVIIKHIVSKLIQEQKYVSQKSSGIRNVLQQYLNDNPNDQIGFARLGRELGVSRQRVWQLYQQLKPQLGVMREFIGEN